MKYYIIDAFADSLFKGNPAGVCILKNEISKQTMQDIATENNLPETAFVLRKNNRYILRWFTPEKEIDLCGHATLACAYAIFNYIQKGLSYIEFETISGTISVTAKDGLLTLDLPSRMPVRCNYDKRIDNALGCNITEAFQSRDLLLIVDNENTVKTIKPDFNLLREISNDIDFTIIVSAKGDSCDFVSRFFIPNSAITEDPVTGSAHSTLIPFWSNRLHKKVLTAKQLSARGGFLFCENLNERVKISGKAICFMAGEINL